MGQKCLKVGSEGQNCIVLLGELQPVGSTCVSVWEGSTVGESPVELGQRVTREEPQRWNIMDWQQHPVPAVPVYNTS